MLEALMKKSPFVYTSVFEGFDKTLNHFNISYNLKVCLIQTLVQC